MGENFMENSEKTGDREKLVIVIPSYNEEGAITEMLTKWMHVFDSLGVQYVIKVYDASKDDTPNILKNLEEKHPSKICPVFCEKIGHGPTLVLAYNENLSYEWLFQIDSDDEMDHRVFHKLWEARNDYDVLLGYREQRKSSIVRRIISFISRMTISIFYSGGIKDVNVPYRLIRTKYLSEFIYKLPPDTFAPNVIMSGWINTQKLRVFQTPVIHMERRTGVMINKWQLLKSSFIPFWQTIVFAFKNKN
jgi:glycosyltransferase involved in cell wall biosynthesis